MYRRIWMNDSTKQFTVLSTHTTLEAANLAREMSGDLIIDEQNVIVPSEEWLFEWEKIEPRCYARRMWGKQVGKERIPTCVH